MSFTMDSLPLPFALAAWQRIAREIDATASVKIAMQAEVLRLHVRNATKREFVRGMGVVLHRTQWDWPRGKALLEVRIGDDVYVEDLLEALYNWFTFSTHKLYRRGQIRTLLADGMDRMICVNAVPDDGQPVPCGAINQQLLVPSEEVLKRLPPCNHPFCACHWTLKQAG